MGNPLQNFVNQVTVVGASWLNQVDVFINTLFNSATTQAQAQTALGVTATGADPAYLKVANNLSDVANGSSALANLGGTTLTAVEATITQSYIGALLYPQTAAEAAASVTPANTLYPPISALRYGAQWNNSSDDTTATNTAILVAQQPIAGAVGQVIALPLGTAIISSQITIPNDVRFYGTNKNGSIFSAAATWNSATSPYMMLAANGTSSMFDSILENLTLNCNDIAGLGGAQSFAWQENSGTRRCLIQKFTTYGIRYTNGYGGAAYSKIEDTEIFASSNGATAGIQVDQISSVGTFVLNLKNVTITWGGSVALPNGVKIANDSSLMESVHVEGCTTGVYIAGVGRHTLINVTGDSNTGALVTIDAAFTGTLTMINCLRGGATNFLVDNRAVGLGTITGADPPFLNITGAAANWPPIYMARAFGKFAYSGSTLTQNCQNATVTRASTGNYSVAFTTQMPNGQYSVMLTAGIASVPFAYANILGTPTAAGFNLETATTGGIADINLVTFVVFSL